MVQGRLAALAAVMLIAGAVGAAYAETVQVTIRGADHDIEYAGTGVSIDRAYPDLDFDSIIFDLSTDVAVEEASIAITLPRNVLDSVTSDGADEPFIVIVDGDEPAFADDGGASSRVITIDIEAGTDSIEIIGTSIGGGGGGAVEDKKQDADGRQDGGDGAGEGDGGTATTAPTPPPPPPPPPPSSGNGGVVCAENYDPVCGTDGMTYGNMCKMNAAGASMDHTGECGDAGQVPAGTAGCGDGTILVNGKCVPACGPGLVLDDGVCVIGKPDGGVTEVPGVQENVGQGAQFDPASSLGFGKDLVIGAMAAFIVAFIVIIVLGAMSRASKSR